MNLLVTDSVFVECFLLQWNNRQQKITKHPANPPTAHKTTNIVFFSTYWEFMIVSWQLLTESQLTGHIVEPPSQQARMQLFQLVSNLVTYLLQNMFLPLGVQVSHSCQLQLKKFKEEQLLPSFLELNMQEEPSKA